MQKNNNSHVIQPLPDLPNFRLLRKSAKVTLRKVEQDIGISNSYLSQLETGKITNPSYEIVKRLLVYYNGFQNAV